MHNTPRSSPIDIVLFIIIDIVKFIKLKKTTPKTETESKSTQLKISQSQRSIAAAREA